MHVILFSLLTLLGATAGPALAAAPEPWQINFQPAATSIMERIEAFNDFISWIIVLIAVFVLVLLIYVCFRYGVRRSPTPSRRTHNTLLEVAWTTVPVLILVVIAIPSFKLLYYQDVVPEVDMTVKAVGHQWYWSYEYPDHGDFTFDAYMVADEDLQEGQLRLLTTDNALVLPVETDIRLQITATDVLHSWAMPSFGVKMDAVPGRLNETWFNIREPGMYYGQCSELCGDFHGFMPIMVRAVPKDEFEAWTEQAQEQFARAGALDLAAR
jgi:cytochrome c oxidase subunit 2